MALNHGHTPVGDGDRAKIRALHAQGLGRNEVARQIGRSGRTVSKLAKEMGLTFERGEQVRAATEARKIDAKARRAALALALLEDAERLREQLWQPCKVFNFGGRENDYNEVEHPQPPPVDKLKLIQAASTAIGRALDLDKHDQEVGGGAAVDTWLDAMLGSPQ